VIEDVFHVLAHRTHRHEQQGRDVSIAVTLCDEFQDLPFPGGQHTEALPGRGGVNFHQMRSEQLQDLLLAIAEITAIGTKEHQVPLVAGSCRKSDREEMFDASRPKELAIERLPAQFPLRIGIRPAPDLPGPRTR
jgi:hypothetical protein